MVPGGVGGVAAAADASLPVALGLRVTLFGSSAGTGPGEEGVTGGRGDRTEGVALRGRRAVGGFRGAAPTPFPTARALGALLLGLSPGAAPGREGSSGDGGASGVPLRGRRLVGGFRGAAPTPFPTTRALGALLLRLSPGAAPGEEGSSVDGGGRGVPLRGRRDGGGGDGWSARRARGEGGGEGWSAARRRREGFGASCSGSGAGASEALAGGFLPSRIPHDGQKTAPGVRGAPQFGQARALGTTNLRPGRVLFHSEGPTIYPYIAGGSARGGRRCRATQSCNQSGFAPPLADQTNKGSK
jgi:hypothetical protein